MKYTLWSSTAFFSVLVGAVAAALLAGPAAAKTPVAYLILAETVEPIMIVRDGDPMAGGVVTEIVTMIFADSDYVIEPLVLPWRRMKEEFEARDDWIVHGFPESFTSAPNAEFSTRPIFPFNHSAVTLKDENISVSALEDLRDRTVILVENFHYPLLDGYLAEPAGAAGGHGVATLRAFTPAGTLRMLRHKRGDVVIDWQARLIYNLPDSGLSYEAVEFHDASAIVPTKNLHLVFSSKQTDEFRSFVNRRIEVLTRSGQLRALAEKYYHPATPPRF